MKNYVLSILFFLCSIIDLCGVIFYNNDEEKQTFIVCMGMFFLVCSLLFLKIGDKRKVVERKANIETFLSKSEKKDAAKKKASKAKKNREAEDKTIVLLQKSKNALSIAESESSTVDDIKKAVADTKTFADECSVIVSAIKTTKTKYDANATRTNAEKAADALKTRLASDEAKRPKGVPNVYFVQISSVTGRGINVSLVEVFDDKGVAITGLKCDPKTTGPYSNDNNVSCQYAVKKNSGSSYYSHDNQNATMIIDLGGPKTITKVTVHNRENCCQERMGSAPIALLNKDYKPFDNFSTTLLPGSILKQTVKYYNTDENKLYEKPLNLSYV